MDEGQFFPGQAIQFEGPGRPPAPPAAISFIGSTAIQGAGPHTFTNHAIGTASSDRLVVVAVHAEAGSGTMSASVTIGGVAATLVDQVATSTGGYVGIFQRAVSSGTTATIVTTFSGASPARCIIGVWALTKLQSQTASATNKASNGAAGTSLSTSISVPSKGVAVAASTMGNNSNHTWTNASERYDQNAGGTTGDSGGDASNSGATASITFTAAYASADKRTLVAACWR